MVNTCSFVKGIMKVGTPALTEWESSSKFASWMTRRKGDLRMGVVEGGKRELRRGSNLLCIVRKATRRERW